jgi:hypothetical protein
MAVHFIAIKISIVRSTDTCVEPKSSPFHHLDAVRHDRHFVKRWLTIKKNNITVLLKVVEVKSANIE